MVNDEARDRVRPLLVPGSPSLSSHSDMYSVADYYVGALIDDAVSMRSTIVILEFIGFLLSNAAIVMVLIPKVHLLGQVLLFSGLLLLNMRKAIFIGGLNPWRTTRGLLFLICWVGMFGLVLYMNTTMLDQSLKVESNGRIGATLAAIAQCISQVLFGLSARLPAFRCSTKLHRAHMMFWAGTLLICLGFPAFMCLEDNCLGVLAEDDPASDKTYQATMYAFAAIWLCGGVVQFVGDERSKRLAEPVLAITDTMSEAGGGSAAHPHNDAADQRLRAEIPHWEPKNHPKSLIGNTASSPYPREN